MGRKIVILSGSPRRNGNTYGDAGDMEGKPELQKAYELGKSI